MSTIDCGWAAPSSSLCCRLGAWTALRHRRERRSPFGSRRLGGASQYLETLKRLRLLFARDPVPGVLRHSPALGVRALKYLRAEIARAEANYPRSSGSASDEVPANQSVCQLRHRRLRNFQASLRSFMVDPGSTEPP